MSKEIDCRYTEEIVCPYCGYEHGDSWEYSDESLTECGSCEKKFLFRRDCEVTYLSFKSPCSNGEEPHEFNPKYDHLIEKGFKEGLIQNTCKKCRETVYRNPP